MHDPLVTRLDALQDRLEEILLELDTIRAALKARNAADSLTAHTEHGYQLLRRALNPGTPHDPDGPGMIDGNYSSEFLSRPILRDVSS